MPAACAGATATRLQNGRVLVTGGGAYVYDPVGNSWSTVPGMSIARTGATATMLADGRVLVAGGYAGSSQSAACDLFDPASSTWSPAAAMTAARDMHAATLLPNGRVLVTGGFDRSNLSSRNTCEEYDPVADQWTPRGLLGNARRNHVLALLPTGGLLAVGGGPLACEIYNAGTWTPTAVSPFGAETATVLPTGHVLALTGTGCALFQATSPAWQGAGDLATGTVGSTAHLLPNGRVLAAPCYEAPTSAQRSNEYDPQANAWSPAGDLSVNRGGCPTALLGTGKVLIAGSTWTPFNTCQLYDPAARTWGPTGNMLTSYVTRRLTVLASGQVLASGGENFSTNVSTAACELYDPLSGTWSPTGAMLTARTNHTATLLPNGMVLVVGGYTQDPGLTTTQASCELYDPRTGTWSYTGSLTTFRYGHSATVLPSGRVLVAGGRAGANTWSSCEVYEPLSGEWTVTGAMATARGDHGAILLPTGRVLVSGGKLGSGYETAACEEFEPISGVWTAAPSLAGGRYGHACTLLPDGSVLVTGGAKNSVWQLATSERYVLTVDAARRPAIASAIQGTDRISVTGSGFVPVHSASADQNRSSAANLPCVSWRRNDNGRIWWLTPVGGFSATATERLLPADAVGDGQLTVHVGGIASAAAYLRIDPPAVTLGASAGTISENGGTCTVTATTARVFAWPITVTLTVGGTAGPGDASLDATTLTIPAGSLSAATVLRGTPDLLTSEGDETVIIDIGTVVNGAEAGTQRATITLTDYVPPGDGPPVVQLPNSLLSYTEDQAAIPLDAAATVRDDDSADFAGGVMTVRFNLGGSADDRLAVEALGEVTVSGAQIRVGGVTVATAAGGIGTTPLTLAWNAAATPGAGGSAAKVLRAVCYRNVSQNPSTAVRIVEVETSDGDGGVSLPARVTVTVAAVNDPPVISGAAPAGTYLEDAAPLLLGPGLVVSDPDSPAFASGTLSATLQTGGEASDVLAIRNQGSGPGQIGLVGADVTYGGTAFGTWSGGTGPATPLVVLLDAQASQAAVQALLGNLTYVSTSQHPSTVQRTVRLRLTDGAGGVSPDADIQVAVQSENDAPTATVALWQVNPGTENSIPPINLTISDVDEPADHTLVATITALPAGTVTINGTTALVGSHFNRQDLIANEVRYLAPGSSGNSTLSFTIHDGTDPGPGTYNLPIRVTDGISNLPPVVALPSDGATWQEGLPPVLVDPNAEVTDGDSLDGNQPVLSGGQLTAAVTLNGTGAERLSISDSGGVTVSAGTVAVNGVVVGTITGGSGPTLSVSLNAAATPARVTRVARAISFAVDAAAPGATPRRVTVQVSDGTSASEAKNTVVQVLEVNSPPVVALMKSGASTTEGESPLVLVPAATCTDTDNADLGGGQVVVSLADGDGFDRLALTGSGSIAIDGNQVSHGGAVIGTWSGGGGVPITVLLNAQATDAKVADLLHCVTLVNISENPVAGMRTVGFSVSDGGGATGTASLAVYVAALNDAPEVTISAGPVVWRQGEPATRIDAAALVTDVDSANFAGGRLTAFISIGADTTSDRLSLVPTGDIDIAGTAVTWDGTSIGTVSGGLGSTPLVVTLTADATPDRVRDLLRCLAFDSGALPSTQDRTVAVIVEDGDAGASTQRTRVVQVERVNQRPVVTLSSGSAAYVEDQPAVAVDPAAAVSDDSNDLDGGRLTVSVVDGDAADRLSIAHVGIAAAEIGLAGSSVTWGGTVIGTWSGGSGTVPLVVDLVAPASPAALQGLVQALRYATVSQNPLGTRSIGVVLSDGDGGTSVQATRTVARSGVNDAPDAAATVLTVTGQTATGRWQAVDPEGDTFVWSVEQQPANGTITITDAATGAWSFAPTAGVSGAATARLRVTDSHLAARDLDAVQVVVTGPADPAPVVASDPPLSVQVGQTWTWTLAVSELGGAPDLELEAIGAPAGFAVAVTGGGSATASWAVPGNAMVGRHERFLLRISDRSTGRTALVPIIIYLRAAIAGGG